MIYALAKFLFQQSLGAYYKKISVKGVQQIPLKAPVIFVANHPNTLIDPLLIGTIVPREIHFLAAAEFMGKGLVRKILQRHFNMIPVFRPQTRPGETQKNEAIFSQCITHLQGKGTLLIFPEGTSVTSHRMQPLKTGTARIALSTIATNQKNTPLFIVPIGLNYSDAHTFQSNIYVQIGQPIAVHEIKFEPAADDFEKAQKLTQIVENSLQEQINLVYNNKLDGMYEQISELVMNTNFSENGKESSPNESFDVNKQILNGLHFYAKENPQLVNRMQFKIADYLEKTQFLKLSDQQIAQAKKNFSLMYYLKLVVGFPFFLVGFITHALPYYLSVFINKKLSITSSFKGSIGLSVGLVLFLLWYLGLGILLGNLFHQPIYGVLGLLLFYTFGRFTLWYLDWLREIFSKGQFNKRIKKNAFMMNRLIHERQELITQILTQLRMNNPITS